jgi:hypothetical protein
VEEIGALILNERVRRKRKRKEDKVLYIMPACLFQPESHVVTSLRQLADFDMALDMQAENRGVLLLDL